MKESPNLHDCRIGNPGSRVQQTVALIFETKPRIVPPGAHSIRPHLSATNLVTSSEIVKLVKRDTTANVLRSILLELRARGQSEREGVGFRVTEPRSLRV